MIKLKLLWSMFGPPLAKPIFGISLGGSTSVDKSKSNTNSSVNKTGESITDSDALSSISGVSSSSSSDNANQSTIGSETLSTLDDETKATLSGLLSELASGGSSVDLISALNSRALSAEDRLPDLVDPIVANARGNLEEQAGQAVQGFARSAGSSQNTLVAQLGLQEATNVEREIADLAATLGLNVDQAITEQQQGAVGNTENLVASLAEILKGATQVGSSSESTDIVRQLEELVSNSSQERTSGTEVVKTKDSGTASSSSSSRGRTSDVSLAGSIGF